MWTALALAVLTKGSGSASSSSALQPVLYLAAHRKLRKPMEEAPPLLGSCPVPGHRRPVAHPRLVSATPARPAATASHGSTSSMSTFCASSAARMPRDYNKLPTSAVLPLTAPRLALSLEYLRPGRRACSAGDNRARSSAHPSNSRPSHRAAAAPLLRRSSSSSSRISTNQEYYTFPIYLPLLLLICAGLVAGRALPFPPTPPSAGTGFSPRTPHSRRSSASSAALPARLLLVAGSPSLPYTAGHRRYARASWRSAAYTLSMSHFFDLTGPSFAALRLPGGPRCRRASPLGPSNRLERSDAGACTLPPPPPSLSPAPSSSSPHT